MQLRTRRLGNCQTCPSETRVIFRRERGECMSSERCSGQSVAGTGWSKKRHRASGHREAMKDAASRPLPVVARITSFCYFFSHKPLCTQLSKRVSSVSPFQSLIAFLFSLYCFFISGILPFILPVPLSPNTVYSRRISGSSRRFLLFVEFSV